MTWQEIDDYNARAASEGHKPIRVVPIWEDAEIDGQEP